MKIVNIAAFHTVTELPVETDKQIVSKTKEGAIKTVQSIILKAPKSEDSEFTIKTDAPGGLRQAIMNVLVNKNSTRIINVKHQLPAGVGMSACATAGSSVVTVSGIEATLGE